MTNIWNSPTKQVVLHKSANCVDVVHTEIRPICQFAKALSLGRFRTTNGSLIWAMYGRLVVIITGSISEGGL